MNFAPHGINKGKIVYFVDRKRFENTKDKRDGREKAEMAGGIVLIVLGCKILLEHLGVL